jgi:hypothetical protein
MTQSITVQIKSVYGNEVVYPACPKSLLFASIAGTKTLTRETLECVMRLGFEIRVEAPRVTMQAA